MTFQDPHVSCHLQQKNPNTMKFDCIAYASIIDNYYIWTLVESKPTIAKFEVVALVTWFEVAVVELTPTKPCICTP